MTSYGNEGLYFTYSAAGGALANFNRARITVVAEDGAAGFVITSANNDTGFSTTALEVSVQIPTQPDPLGHFDWQPVYGSGGNQWTSDFYRIEHISWGNHKSAVVLTMEFANGGGEEIAMWRLSGDKLPGLKDAAALAAFAHVGNAPVTSADLDLSQPIGFTTIPNATILGQDDLFTPIGIGHIHAVRSFSGGLGNDTIEGGFGNDTFHGDDGNDVLSGSYGSNDLYGGNGDDRLNGGGGQSWAGTVIFGADHLYGGIGNDSLRGGGDGDTLVGGFGNDYLAGDQSGSNTEIFGSSGNDVLYGGGGNDTLFGAINDDIENDRDILFGGSGRDFLQGGPQSDTLTGGAGADVFSFIDGLGEFGSNTGFDEITDFSLASDRLEIGLARADIHASQSVKGLVLDWAGGSVLLDGLHKADFIAIHFL